MKNLNELVKDYLAENHTWCKNANGEYHFEIDVDYRDEIEDSIAQEILDNISPRDTLIERLWDRYQEQEWDIIDNLVDDFKEKVDPKLLEDANIIEDGNLDDGDIRDEFMNIIYIDYPVDWAEDQEFCFNIIVSNGDDNYDFWLNEHIVDEDGKVDENAEKSGLIWLAKQQGYTLDQVVEILKDIANHIIVDVSIFDDIGIFKKFRIGFGPEVINEIVNDIPFVGLIPIPKSFNQSVARRVTLEDFLRDRIFNFVTIIDVNLKVIISVCFFAPSVIFCQVVLHEFIQSFHSFNPFSGF